MISDPKEPEQGKLLGDYRILQEVGSGGMGVVYGAWDTRLERRVALKMVHPHHLSNPAVARRFLQEARAAARIEHPGVVRVYRIDTIGGELAIEMQYIDGIPLSALLRPLELPAGQAADLLHQVLTALAACHAQGVIHCDLKPSNLLIDATGHLYLTDFGIARALQRSGVEQDAPTATTGTVWGTPRYTPPEAWSGEHPTQAWDLYSLGLMLYEALTGRPAFQANTPAALMAQILTTTPEPLSARRQDLSEGFVSLIQDLMAQVPARRPPSAAAALSRLHQTPEYQLSHAETQPISNPAADVVPVLCPAPQVARFTRFPYRAFPALLLVVAVLMGAFWWQRPHRTGAGSLGTPSSPPVQLPAATVDMSSSTPAPHADLGAPGDSKGDIANAETLSLPGPLELVPGNGGVHFVYDDGLHGAELWFASLDGRASLLKDIVPGPEGSAPQYLQHRPGDHGIFFSANTPEFGREPWHCRINEYPSFDVRQVRDIIPGAMGSEPRSFHAIDNIYFFYATTLHCGREIWMSNAREQQTAILTDLLPGIHGSAMMNPKFMATPRGFYFLALSDGVAGQQLFYYNHDRVQVRHIADVSEDTNAGAVLGDAVILSSNDPDHGMEPWIHRPESVGIERLADLYPGAISSDPNHFFLSGEKVYFAARTEATGNELWITDGTVGGTVPLADINPGPEGSDVHAFVDGGERVYFRATTKAHGNELWMSDGTPEGTRIVADAWPGPDSGQPYNIVADEDRVYFTAREPASGEELWLADLAQGAAPQRVTDLWPGQNGSEPHNLRILDRGRAMFTFKSPETGPALAMIDCNVEPPTIKIIELPHKKKKSVSTNS